MAGLLDRLFGRRDEATMPLYVAVVARARAEHWYLAGGVPDTVDGRFDMIAAVLAMVLIRLEVEPAGAGPVARLTECFVEDMDAQLRQLGIGDVVVGKHVGKMMAALGGRLGVYRAGLAQGASADASLEAALVRNLYRGVAPDAVALAHVAGALRTLHDRLSAMPIDRVIEGELP